MYDYRLIVYFMVIPGEANLTLDVKIMEQNSHCRFCGPKLGLDYQMFSTPLARRLFYGALLPSGFIFIICRYVCRFFVLIHLVYLFTLFT